MTDFRHPLPAAKPDPAPTMRQWINAERTVLVRTWASEDQPTWMEVATRPDSGAIWGPPVTVRLEP